MGVTHPNAPLGPHNHTCTCLASLPKTIPPEAEAAFPSMALLRRHEHCCDTHPRKGGWP